MKSSSDLSPLLLFVYNRPVHTKKTLDALALNNKAKESILYIYSDYAKKNTDLESVSSVREIIKNYSDKFKQVIIVERQVNCGLAHNIIDGVSTIISKYGRVIVLEDDLVTSRGFITFMNDSLDAYEYHDNVMHISGAKYPTRKTNHRDESTYFLRIPLCWGWATWKRAWMKYQKNNDFALSISARERSYMDFYGSYPFSRQIDDNLNGNINTWFIFWYLTLIRNNSLALFPNINLVRNIGHDGSGINCVSDERFNIDLHDSYVQILKKEPKEDISDLFDHLRYFYNGKPSFIFKLLMIFRVVKNLVAYEILNK